MLTHTTAYDNRINMTSAVDHNSVLIITLSVGLCLDLHVNQILMFAFTLSVFLSNCYCACSYQF